MSQTTRSETDTTTAQPPSTLITVRALVILLAALISGCTFGLLTWAAEALNPWGALLAGAGAAGASVPILNKLVGH